MTTMRTVFRSVPALLCAFAALFVSTSPLEAQVQGLPRASQRARTIQVVGINEIEVVYHRPGVKGRKVWGDLVPYGQIWRAGANENTVLVLSHAATVEGQDVPAGIYGLHMIPGEEKWTFILSQDSTSWGSYNYKEDFDAVRAEVTPEKAAFTEWLQYDFEPHSTDSATLSLRWDELRVPIRIEVPTKDQVIAKLREEIDSGPLADKWQTFYGAAKFCADSGWASEEALGWIDVALQKKKLFANYMVRHDLLAGLGRTEEAEQVLVSALELGNGSEIASLGNEVLGTGDFDRAAQLYELAVDKMPTLWWAWVRLGDAYVGLDRKEEARSCYDQGLELAPPDQKGFVKQQRDKLDAS